MAAGPRPGNVSVRVPDPPRPTARRIPPARLAIILGVWVMLAGAAILVAMALDNPVGPGARDEAQPAIPGVVADPTATAPAQLPPLALVLDQPLPTVVADIKAPIRQVPVLRRLAQDTAQPRRYVELGSVLQLLGDRKGAEAAYDTALQLDPANVAAKTGLALATGAQSGDGPAAGAVALERLARANPRNQLVAFNQGWLAIYRRQAAPAVAAWTRTVALGRDTRLGRTAAALLASLENGASGRNP